LSDLDLGLSIFGGIVLTLGLLSRWLRQSFIADNILALLAGIIVGPLILDILDITDWAPPEIALEHAARITLAVALMEIALRLPKKEFLHHLRSYAILLGVLMPMMWLTSGFLVALILGLPIWVALLIGAVLSPTDPVVASSIVTGPTARENLPSRIRETLSAESGANDGLAYPFVILPILVLGASFSEVIDRWIFHTILIQVGVAALLGAGVGYIAARLLIWSEARHAIERPALMIYTLALSLTTLGVATLFGTDGILAVFVTGVIFHLVVGRSEDVEVEPVQGALDQFLSIPIFALIGIAIPLQGWIDLGWSGIVLVLAILLLRRLPGMLIVHRWVDPIRSWPDALFLGWFGPIGIAALYYANFAFGHTELDVVWHVGSLVICASIVVHGMTAAPLTKLYGRSTGYEGKDEES
jgi:sodium/hydrogen antiporter